jgi:hypothetical protein
MADEGKWDEKGGPWDKKGSWANRGRWSSGGKYCAPASSPSSGTPQDVFNSVAALGGVLIVSFITPVGPAQSSVSCGPSARSASMQEVADTIPGG